MRRIGYLMGVLGVLSILTVSLNSTKVFAGKGCCGVQETSAAEASKTKCVVCGKVFEGGKAVEVEHEGENVKLCCEHCANTFKHNPDKYCKVKHKEHHEEHHHEEGHHH